ELRHAQPCVVCLFVFCDLRRAQGWSAPCAICVGFSDGCAARRLMLRRAQAFDVWVDLS
ncbi:hypothetical protein A2U01_0065103, partial [Trifolium medium]|nr:hypothetical protein [Trifolium medium]